MTITAAIVAKEIFAVVVAMFWLREFWPWDWKGNKKQIVIKRDKQEWD